MFCPVLRYHHKHVKRAAPPGGGGGPIIVANAAERKALTGLTIGQQVNQTDNGSEWQWEGPSQAYAGALMGTSGNNSSLFLFTQRGLLNGKQRYQPISYVFDEAPAVWGILWTGTAWNIYDNQEAILYTSPDNVEYPWLATFVNGPEGSSPPPVVSPLTAGDLNAGVRLSGATGDGSIANGDYSYRGARGTGAIYYNKVGAPDDQYDQSIAGAVYGFFNGDVQSLYTPASFPAHLGWMTAYVQDYVSGTTPPTATRLDAVVDANWTQLNPS